MDFTEFDRQYKRSRASLIAGEATDLDGVQAQLRQLAGELTGRDLLVARKMIDRLPDLLAAVKASTPSPQSPEMAEARRIVNEGRFDQGTREERLAAFAEARKKIWAIADRAGTDSHQIRWITRSFECSERHLEEGLPWDPLPDRRSS